MFQKWSLGDLKKKSICLELEMVTEEKEKVSGFDNMKEI